jgi:hypothetical protein
VTMHHLPRPCQAAKSECISWMMYSCKSMNSATFIPAIKKALNIRDNVEIGIQYQASYYNRILRHTDTWPHWAGLNTYGSSSMTAISNYSQQHPHCH